MIEDVIAQSHLTLDALTFEQTTIALSALRSIQEGQSVAGPFAQLLGLTITHSENGNSQASLEVKQHLLNPLGIAHGGVTFSLADTVCGAAAVSALGAERVVTQELQIRYHGPARPGILIAKALVEHFGQRTIRTSCRVTQDNLLIATADATFAILAERDGDTIRE